MKELINQYKYKTASNMPRRGLGILLAFTIALSGCGIMDSSDTAMPDSFETSSAPTASVTPSFHETTNTADSSYVPETTEYEPPRLSEAEIVLQSMTTEEKIGQMFFAAVRKDANGSGITGLTDHISALITENHIGGYILFSENIVTETQTKGFISELKSLSKIPLFVGVDEEGGLVSRTGALGYEKIPAAEAIGKAGQEKAYACGATIGAYLSELGFNVDFAPDSDINTNPANTVIGSRAFGSDELTVSKMVVAFLNGLNDEGIMGTVKHFPGHGDTNQDSHYGFASVTHDIKRLRAVETVPFKAAIDNGVPFVMVGHISVPNVTGDDMPATLSKTIVTDLLRDELGFKGIIITDAMDMGAITNAFSSGEAAVKAILAGVDMILMPQNFEEAYASVVNAVKEGTIGIDRIDESVLRILEIKYK